MKIEKNAFVSLTYELHTQNAAGPVVDSADAERPLQFVHGAGRMLEMFEKNIAGLEAGADFEFALGCDDAYGQPTPEAIVDIPKEVFVVNGQLRTDLLVVGKNVPMMGEGGRPLNGIVLEVTDNTVKMDFNHPLAGEDLFFKGKILEVREATAEELIGPSCGGGCSGGCCGGCGSSDDESCGCGGGCH